MSYPAITVENLSKAYRIGAKEEVPDTLMSAIADVVRFPLRNFNRLRRLSNLRVGDEGEDVLWALKDVAFEVKVGEVVGVIGRNGAGKSTLLKVLSRITEPTSGRAVIRGRVASLLEVGTGFHPELTGRENIYMNGTILGMTKREIDRKFDEIVDFSGVEKFLDTPTKRYSSGMQVRLAFAVAAHLEPEILIIDEVLAVGDAAFQKKCISKMQGVADSGRTVVFVSHNLSAVRQICTRGLVIRDGRLVLDSDVSAAVSEYTGDLERPRFQSSDTEKPLCISQAFVQGQRSEVGESVVTRGDRFVLNVDVLNSGASREIGLGISIESSELVRIIGDCTLSGESPHVCRAGLNRFSFSLPAIPLNQGIYFVTLAVHDWGSGATVDRRDQCLSFEVIEPGSGSGVAGKRRNNGLVICNCAWEEC